MSRTSPAASASTAASAASFCMPGRALAARAFPKDCQALVRTAREAEAPLAIVETVVRVNEARKRRMADKIIAACGGTRRRQDASPCSGLTFKPNTDDMRDSPSLAILPRARARPARRSAPSTRKGMDEAKKLMPDLDLLRRRLRDDGGRRRAGPADRMERVPRPRSRPRRAAAARAAGDRPAQHLPAGTRWRRRGSPIISIGRPAASRSPRRIAGARRDARRALVMSVVRKRVLVTGGAGFLGSHLCERLVARGDDVLCVDNYFTGRKDNIAAPAGRPAFRGDAPRHHASAVCRGRRDLQPRLPGLADPLPVRSGADHQDQRHRRDQHAGPRQAAEGQDLPGLDLRGLWRPDPASAAREPIAATSTRSGRAPATTRASAAPRPCSSTITASTICGSGSSASSTPTGRACTPMTAASSPTSSSRRLQGEPITLYGDGTPDPRLLLCRRSDRGLPAADGRPRRRHRPDQPRQPGRDLGRRTRRA